MFSATINSPNTGRIGSFGLSYDKNSIYYGYAGYNSVGLGFFQTYVKNSSGAGIVQITAGVVTNGVYLARNANSWSAVSSDARNKKDFETTQGLAEVLQIETVKYNYIWDEEGQTKRLGFTAQNIQPLIPEMVIATGKKADDGSDYLTITPDYLLPVLVKAIQELSAEVEALKAKIK